MVVRERSLGGGLGGRTYGLIDGDVDDVRGDAGGYDQVAETLGFENGAGGFGAVEYAVD